MKNKSYLLRFLAVFFLIIFTFIYKIFFCKYDYKKLQIDYIPNYKDKYEEVVGSYNLISDNYNFIPAQSINLNNKKITNLFYINVGIDNGIIENSYVVDSKGLVGVVKKVFNKYSIVQLITSDNLSVAVEVNDCYGTLKNIDNKAIVEDLINCKNINIGDPVFTSKYSISSSNILVGYIRDIKKDKLYISYLLNPYKIKYLGVIYDNN